MAEEPRMNFYRTFYDLTTLLPERERQKVNTALLDYFFNGTEPIGLSENGMKVFNGCAGRITKSRTNAANRAAGYAQTERERTAKRKRTRKALRNGLRNHLRNGLRNRLRKGLRKRPRSTPQREKEKEIRRRGRVRV